MSQEQENVEVVRRVIDGVIAAGTSDDWAPVLAELDPEVEVDDLDTVLDSNHFEGHDGFFKWLAVWNESWESWKLEDLEVLPAGEDQAIAQFMMVATGKGSGMELSRPDAITFKLRDGKIVGLAYYNDQRRAREAVGLRE